jgi:hypothetical protein
MVAICQTKVARIRTMSQTEILAWGFVGGIIPDILRTLALRFQGAPLYFQSWFFWVSLIVLGILGALACWLVTPTKVIEAFAVGYSAPAILTRLGGDIPKGVGDRDDRGTPPPIRTLRQWWGM